MVTKQMVEFYGFSNCVCLTNGDAELIVATEIPYVLSYRKADGKNLLRLDPNLSGKRDPKCWLNYGGSRLWSAPEADGRANEPDSFAQDYELTDSGVILTQRTLSDARTKKRVEITMADEGTRVNLRYELENCNLFDVTLSAWAITVLRTGGVNVVRQIDVDTKLLPNRSMVFWPYTKLNDPRLTLGAQFVSLRQDPTATTPIKIGMPLFDGTAAYFTDGEVFVKRFPPLAEEELYPMEDEPAYPDAGCNFESYTCATFLESESLGPLTRLKTGEIAEHEEEWEIFNAEMPASESAMAKLFDQIR